MGKAEPTKPKLWSNIREELRSKYVDLSKGKRWNAYLSGMLVKEYKKRGGTFKDDVKKTKTDLWRWFAEKWVDVGHKDYPVYRPSLRINKKTPLTSSEIDKKQLKEQIKRKQVITGYKNLEPFKKKVEKKVEKKVKKEK